MIENDLKLQKKWLKNAKNCHQTNCHLLTNQFNIQDVVASFDRKSNNDDKIE